MIKNKLLRHQIATFICSCPQPSAELMELLTMISDTYDLYEHKLSARSAPSHLGGESEIGQLCPIR
jgi:hypothetical protein